ncbi:MAG: hypothetical protein IPO26_19005 [Saprospiraceae bacterium]|nr:hypothetical protein [Saprospiraceae bacterium]
MSYRVIQKMLKRMADKYRENAENRQMQTYSNSIDITDQVNACLPVVREIAKEVLH